MAAKRSSADVDMRLQTSPRGAQSRTPTKRDLHDDDPYPRPTRPAGWPEIAIGAWWLLIVLIILGVSTTFWLTSWPAPKGIAIFRIQLGFALPLATALLGGLIALLAGTIGLLRERFAPAPRRVLRRAAA